MRALALLALAFLIPSAAAQPSLDPAFSVEAFDAPLPPLQAAVSRNFTLEALCEPAPPGAAPAAHVWVAEAPTWVIATVEPDTFPLDTCAGQRVRVSGVVKAQASDQGPAGVPAPLRIGWSVDALRGNLTGTAETMVSSGYFGILDVQLEESVFVVEPGGSLAPAIRLSNFGNAKGIVRAELEQVGDGLRVEPPPLVELESKQEGGSAIARDLPLRIEAKPRAGYVNEVGMVAMRLSLARASDSAQGDESSVSLVVTIRGAGVGLDAPAPGVWAAMVVGAAALLRRREKRRA